MFAWPQTRTESGLSDNEPRAHGLTKRKKEIEPQTLNQENNIKSGSLMSSVRRGSAYRFPFYVCLANSL